MPDADPNTVGYRPQRELPPKRKFSVSISSYEPIYWTIEVEAENEDEACELARDRAHHVEPDDRGDWGDMEVGDVEEV